MEKCLITLRGLLLARKAQHLAERPPNLNAAADLEKVILQLDVKNVNPLTRVNAVPAPIDHTAFALLASITGESDADFEAFTQHVDQLIAEFNNSI